MKLTARQLRRVITEEVALHNLRRTVRLHIESALLEQASLEDMNEGFVDDAKRKIKDAGVLLGLLGALSTPQAVGTGFAQLTRDTDQIAQDLAEQESAVARDDLKTLLDKVDAVAPGEKAGIVQRIVDLAAKESTAEKSRPLMAMNRRSTAGPAGQLPRELSNRGGLKHGAAMTDALEQLIAGGQLDNGELAKIIVRFDAAENLKKELRAIIKGKIQAARADVEEAQAKTAPAR